MAKGTGIEIGETAVTVVEIDGSPKKFRITGTGRTPIETTEPGEDRIRAVAQAVRGAMKGARASRDQVVVSLPARDVIVREIQLPFTDEEQIRKVIKFESESHLHSCDIDDVVVGFQKIGDNGQKSRVLIFAVRKDQIRDALDSLDRIGVDPLHVTIDATALFGLWRALPSGQSDGTFVILDVGEVTTTAMVTQGDKIRLVRGIRLGTETITRVIATDMGIDREEARTKTQQFRATSTDVFAIAGDVDEQAPSTATSAQGLQRDIIRDSHGGFARRLANEVRRSLSSVLLDGKVEGVFLTGVGGMAPGLVEAMQEQFHVPIQRLDTTEGVDHKLTGDTAWHIGVGAGLGLIPLGHDPLKLDFRQEEFKFARKFDRLKWMLLTALSLVLFLVGFLIIGEINDTRAYQRRLDDIATYARTDARSFYVPLLKDPKTAAVLDDSAGETKSKPKSAEEVDKQLDAAAPGFILQDIGKLFTSAASIVERKYGMSVTQKPGEKPSENIAITVSALSRLSKFMGVLNKHPELQGKFAVNKLLVSSVEITWDMDLEDESSWDSIARDLRALDGVQKVEPGTIKPQGLNGWRRYEQCKVTWPRENQ